MKNALERDQIVPFSTPRGSYACFVLFVSPMAGCLVTSFLVGIVVLALTAALTMFLQATVVAQSEASFRSLLEARASEIDGLARKFEGELRSATVFGVRIKDNDRAFTPEVLSDSWFPLTGIGPAAEGGKSIDISDRDWYQALVKVAKTSPLEKAVVSKSNGDLVRCVRPQGPGFGRQVRR